MSLNADIGGTSSNSYVTRVEADAYFTDRMHSSTWFAITDALEKDKLLISSSQMLDWYVNWKGDKTATTQSMRWPRSGALRPDTDGTEISSSIIPPEVKIAVYELALINISEDRMTDDPLAGIGEIKAGSLMIKAGAEKPNQTNARVVPDQIYRILSDIYTQGSPKTVVRLIRA
ncbi:MAG: hypothetical protein GY861_14320 [bacterium]|nr:hypothetical protein [bacterium]